MQFIKKIAFKLIVVIVLLVACELLFNFLLDPYYSYGRNVNHDLEQVQGSIDTVFVGASWTYFGYNVDEYDRRTGSTAFNIGTFIQSMQSSYYYLKEVAEKNPVQTVFFNISSTKFTSSPDVKSVMVVNDRLTGMNKFMHLASALSVDDLSNLLPSFNYKDYFHVQTMENNIKYKMTDEYRDYKTLDPFYQKDGYVSTNISLKQGGNSEFVNIDWDESKVLNTDLDYFNKIVNLCKEKHIKLTITAPPFSAAYLQNNTHYDDYLNFIRDLCKQNDVEFIDFNLLKDPVFLNDGLFNDFMHLNGTGNVILTNLLCDIMQEKQKGISSDYRFYATYADKEKVFNYCTGVKLYFQKPQNDEGVLNLSAKAANTNNIQLEYRFSVFNQDSGQYEIIQDYSASNRAAYNYPHPGNIKFRVDCRAVGSSHDYEAYNENSYEEKATETGVQLSKEKQANSAVLKANVLLEYKGQVEYEFLKTNDGTNFQIVQDYTQNDQFIIEKDDALFYRVNVRIKGSQMQYEDYAYDIGRKGSPIDFGKLDLNGTIDQQDPAKLHLSASTFNTPVLYRFSIWTPGDIYKQVTNYSLSSKLDVILPYPGMYRYRVECIEAGFQNQPPATKDFFINYKLTYPDIRLNATGQDGGVLLNADSPNGALMQFQFGYYDQNNNFIVIQDYSSKNTAWCSKDRLQGNLEDLSFKVNCRQVGSQNVQGYTTALFSK